MEVITFLTDNQKTLEINPLGNNFIKIIDSDNEEVYYQTRDDGFSFNKNDYGISFSRHKIFYKLNIANYKLVFSYFKDEKSIDCNFYIDILPSLIALVVVYNPKLKPDPKLVLFYDDNTKFEMAPNEKYCGEDLIYSAQSKPVKVEVKKTKKAVKTIPKSEVNDEWKDFASVMQDLFKED